MSVLPPFAGEFATGYLNFYYFMPAKRHWICNSKIADLKSAMNLGYCVSLLNIYKTKNGQ
jgi:hypothetical protein